MLRLDRLKRGVALDLRALAARWRRWRAERDRPAREETALREVVQLAWPIGAAMLGETAMGLVDTRLVGALGARALGGVGVAITLMYLGYATVFGLMRGVKVRTAWSVGQALPGRGVRYAQAGVVMGALAGVVFWALARDIRWALAGLRVDAGLVPYAQDFLAARTWGAPAVCMVSALHQYRQAMGDSRTPMRVGLVANVLNATLAWALIYGHGGLPALGVRGAGYATATAEWFQAAWLLALLARDARRQGTPALSLRVAAREVAGLGVPTGLQYGCEMMAFTAFTAMLGSLGATEIAAHQVALATIRASFLPGIAISEAASVLVGRALGRRRLAEADAMTRAALLVGVGFMAACGMIFAVAGGAIARVFTDDPAVAQVARRLLLVAALFQVLDAVNIVLRGALRGAKDVRAVAVIAIAAVWVFVPGSAWLLGDRAGLGALGGWCGFVGETAVTAALFWWRWRRGAWRAAYPAREPSRVEGPALAVASTPV